MTESISSDRQDAKDDLREPRRRRELGRDRLLPPRDLLGRGCGAGVAMADIHLPPTLPPLFENLPRRLDIDATTVDEAIERLNEQWPGMRDRLCEPGPVLRPHINVYVDQERASLETALEAGSRVDVLAAISGG